MASQGRPSYRKPGQPAMAAADNRLVRTTQFYWKEMIELKAECLYHRLYRDDQAKWDTRFSFVKAIATSSTIAGWVIWQQYAIIWGTIIALSQLMDALKDVFPHAKSRKASADLANTLDVVFIDARIEFGKILFGSMTQEDADTSLRKLQKLRHDAELKCFPEGVIKNSALQDKAAQQAKLFFTQVYPSDKKVGA
jgi:hypothetical protein